MHILITALVLGVAANLDNFGIGISYGIQKVRIPFLSNFFIALLSGIIAYLAVLAGQVLGQFMGVANLLGAFMIVVIGIWVIIHKSTADEALPVSVSFNKAYTIPLTPLGWVIQITKNPSRADLDANGFISVKEAIALGITLSFNCIATGVGSGLTGLPPFPVAISVLLFSMLTISLGYWTGWKTASNRLERWSQAASGILLILIGIYEIFN